MKVRMAWIFAIVAIMGTLYLKSPSDLFGMPLPRNRTKVTPPPTMDIENIEPGLGLGSVAVGDKEEKVVQRFPVKPKFDLKVTHSNCGFQYKVLSWIDTDQKPPGNLWFYFRENRLIQIRISDSHFKTPGGISLNTSPEAVRKEFQNLRAFHLSNSGSQYFHGRDLIYWIDEERGIAFEFFWNETTHSRRVYSIFVFNPGSTFYPQLCVESPQVWQQIDAFSFEP